MKVPLIIVLLFIVYLVLQLSSKETFNRVQTVLPRKESKREDLIIKPSLLKGVLPIAKNIQNRDMIIHPITNVPKRDDISMLRENAHKQLYKSMLLSNSDYNNGYIPANAREVELSYLKPSQIGRIPIYRESVVKRSKKTIKSIEQGEENDE